MENVSFDFLEAKIIISFSRTIICKYCDKNITAYDILDKEEMFTNK